MQTTTGALCATSGSCPLHNKISVCMVIQVRAMPHHLHGTDDVLGSGWSQNQFVGAPSAVPPHTHTGRTSMLNPAHPHTRDMRAHNHHIFSTPGAHNAKCHCAPQTAPPTPHPLHPPSRPPTASTMGRARAGSKPPAFSGQSGSGPGSWATPPRTLRLAPRSSMGCGRCQKHQEGHNVSSPRPPPNSLSPSAQRTHP